MFAPDALTHYDDLLFLAQTLDYGQKAGRITLEQVDKIHQDSAALAHKLITIKVEDLSSSAEIRGQVQEAFALVSLGLEFGSQGNLDKSVRLLNKNRLLKFFQIGNTLVDKLAERAKTSLKKGALTSPETPTVSFIEQEHLPTYNEWEREFLEAVLERKLLIDAAQVMIHELSTTPRPLMSLADFAIVNRQLDYFEYRLSCIQALPQDKIFAAEFIPDTDGDYVRQITKALMVNLILYREIDFHLNLDDLHNFRDIAYDAEDHAVKKSARDWLIGWIGHYMDLTKQPQEVKTYAVEYWRYCLKQLEAELILEEAVEVVDVLRTQVLVQNDL